MNFCNVCSAKTTCISKYSVTTVSDCTKVLSICIELFADSYFIFSLSHFVHRNHYFSRGDLIEVQNRGKQDSTFTVHSFKEQITELFFILYLFSPFLVAIYIFSFLCILLLYGRIKKRTIQIIQDRVFIRIATISEASKDFRPQLPPLLLSVAIAKEC